MNLDDFAHDGRIGPMIHHPLYVGLDLRVFGNPQLCDIEEIIEAKQAQVEAYTEAGKWESVLWTYERPYRTETLFGLWKRHGLHAGIVGPLCRQVWMDCENIDQTIELWKIFYRDVPAEAWMSVEDLQVMEDLPAKLTLHRGECDDGGISWTLDPRVARFFAQRGLNNATGETTTLRDVDKRHVWAFFGGRGESEIIMLPEGWLT